jgi:hypothetical protein
MGSKDGVFDLFFCEVSVNVLKVASGDRNGFPIYVCRSRSAFIQNGGEVIFDDCLLLAVVGCPSIVTYALVLVVEEILLTMRVDANVEKLTLTSPSFKLVIREVCLFRLY